MRGIKVLRPVRSYLALLIISDVIKKTRIETEVWNTIFTRWKPHAFSLKSA